MEITGKSEVKMLETYTAVSKHSCDGLISRRDTEED